MSTPLATIVEWDLLLQVIWVALAAGVAVTIAASLAILGAGRAADARRDGDTIDAIIFTVMFVFGLLVCLGAVVFGVYGMASK